MNAPLASRYVFHTGGRFPRATQHRSMAEELNSEHPSPSRLDLRVTFPDDLADNPSVTILIDDIDFSDRYVGFPADEILGSPVPVPLESGEWVDPPEPASSPLAAQERGTRIAVYQCSCGVAGCGSIAPVIARDGDVVTWTDFRDFTGVFDRPDDASEGAEGDPLETPQLRFDAKQYDAELARAVADRSWESPSRATARILRAMLAEHEGLLANSNRRLGWVVSGWWHGGAGRFVIELRDPTDGRRQYIVAITAKFGTPTSRARSMVDRLLAVPVEDWHSRFPDKRR